MTAPLTPEQEAMLRDGFITDSMVRAALATIDELRVSVQRATLDAALFVDDARRWRAVRDRIFTSGNEKADEAADRLADAQERTDG